jgi:hypothetical protein
MWNVVERPEGTAMIARIFIGAGLFALGFFLGKEIGRTEPIRDKLRRAAGGGGEGMPTELKSGHQADFQVSPARHPTVD